MDCRAASRTCIEKAKTQGFGAFTVPALTLLVVGMIAVVGVHRLRRALGAPHPGAVRQADRWTPPDGRPVHAPAAEGELRRRDADHLRQLHPLGADAVCQLEIRAQPPAAERIFDALRAGEPWYELLSMVAIVFFAYFYISIVFRPDDIADNMRKYGGFIPGIRPGRRTSDYINDILTRITLVGAIYLIVVWLIPQIMINGIHLENLWLVGSAFEKMPTWVTHGLGLNFYFGGTSLLIVVGVAMDTVNQVESQLIMRHYEGFSPRSGRVRGRRAW